MKKENDINFNLSSSTIDKGLDSIKGFLQKIIGPSVEEIGLLFGDRVRLWRFKNQIGILKDAEEYINKKGLKTKQIQLKALVPLLDGMSLEEDESLKEMWVNLLVNFIDADKKYKSSIYPYILTQLSTDEAKLLEFIRAKKAVISFDDFPNDLDISDAETSNLIRLGLLRQLPPNILITDEHPHYQPTFEGEISIEDRINLSYDKDDFRYELTELGSNFIDACQLDK